MVGKLLVDEYQATVQSHKDPEMCLTRLPLSQPRSFQQHVPLKFKGTGESKGRGRGGEEDTDKAPNGFLSKESAVRRLFFLPSLLKTISTVCPKTKFNKPNT
jgi:hypothetical protein